MRPLNEIIIHATATKPDWWAKKSSTAKVNEIRRWHVQDRGWSDIGYHFLIDRDGTVKTGRPIEKIGAHTRGHNTGTIGISLFGGFGGAASDNFSENFTPEQEKALKNLLDDLQDKYGKMKISGHNQYAAKACPCFNVPNWVASQSAKPPKQPPTVTIPPVEPEPTTQPASQGGFFSALVALIKSYFGSKS